MKSTWLTGCCLFLASALGYGADLGVATIVEGSARVLRGANWHKLVEGARIQDGDVIDSAERSQVQIEFANGPIVSFAGPADIYAAGAGSREGKQPAPTEIYLPQGWLKFSVRQSTSEVSPASI